MDLDNITLIQIETGDELIQDKSAYFPTSMSIDFWIKCGGNVDELYEILHKHILYGIKIYLFTL